MRSPRKSPLRILALGALSALALVAGAQASTTLRAVSAAEDCGPPIECGTIRIEKQTNPEGSPAAFDFTGAVMATLGDSGSASASVVPGEHSVTEAVKEGWSLASITCEDPTSDSSGNVGTRTANVNVAPGETVVCTFLNEQDSRIVVTKETIPNGDPQEFQFDARYADGGFSLSDGESNDSGDLDPGEYVVSEDVPAGWDLSSIDCGESNATVVGNSVIVFVDVGDTVTCTFTNTKRGTIIVEKQTNPDGASGTFNFNGDAAGSIADNGQIVVTNLAPGTYSATEATAAGFELTGIACDDADSTGDAQARTATFNLQPGETVECTFTNAQNNAPVEIAPRLVDLAIVKTASSAGALNGIVDYSLTVTNNGPDTSTNVQVADPAPAGVRYLTVSTTRGSCNLAAALVTCSLGDLAARETTTIRLAARATTVGRHTNVATVTVDSSETNTANNVDDAATTVRARNARRAKPACLTLTVSPKMIKADGKPDRVRVKVTSGNRRMHGTRVTLVGAGVRKSGRSNGNGMAYIRINPRKTGLITITARERNRKLCGAKRVGVAGVFRQRPLTG